MKTTFFSALLCAATLFLSCSKDDDNKGGNSGFQWDKGKVFVGGAEKNADDKSVATLWIDGKAKSLSDGTQNSQVLDVAATATKVYAAGTENGIGVLWTNGVAMLLTDAQSDYGSAGAVFVSGNDVYVTSQELASSGSIVKLWKNGEVVSVLSEGKSEAVANSIFVSGSDVYVVGAEVNGALVQAVLWTNGTKTFLTETSGQVGNAFDVIVSGSDVYIAGTEGQDAVLWKNNKDGKTVLANGVGVSAKSLAVINGQINVVGVNLTNEVLRGALWIKTAAGAIREEGVSAFSKIHSIATSDSKTYMAGVTLSETGKKIAILSENDVPKKLTDGTREAYANSVCVR